MNDLAAAKEAVLTSVGVIAVIVGAIVLAWKQISRQRLGSATDDNERKRLQDAFDASIAARARAHKLANEMQALQHRMGRLEAENEACNQRTDELRIEVKELRAENREQAKQIAELMRKKTVNPSASDYGARP